MDRTVQQASEREHAPLSLQRSTTCQVWQDLMKEFGGFSFGLAFSILLGHGLIILLTQL